MNDNQNKILWAVGAVIASIAIGCLIFAFKGEVSQTFGTITSPASQLDYVNVTQAIGFGPNNQNIGSSSTNIMGVRSLITPTQFVLCSMANPFNATSTIINASFNTTIGTSTAMSYTFAVASSATATTTVIGQPTGIAANALGTIQTSGIASTTDTSIPVGPGQFLNVGTTPNSGSIAAALVSGTCNAVFESAN